MGTKVRAVTALCRFYLPPPSASLLCFSSLLCSALLCFLTHPSRFRCRGPARRYESLEDALEDRCGGLVHPHVVFEEVGELLEEFQRKCEGQPIVETGNAPGDEEFDEFRHRPEARAAAAEEEEFEFALRAEARAALSAPTLTVAELKEALRQRGLGVKGKKAELQQRLLVALERETAEDEAAAARSPSKYVRDVDTSSYVGLEKLATERLEKAAAALAGAGFDGPEEAGQGSVNRR